SIGDLGDFEIVCLDSSAEANRILAALRDHHPYQSEGHQIVTDQGALMLTGMAQVFGATHSTVNTWLTDPVALAAQLQQWINLGIGLDFSIPPDVGHTLERLTAFLENGIIPKDHLLASLDPHPVDIGTPLTSFTSPTKATIFLSNFSLQYPLWAGQGDTVMSN